jgi:hypothetical protein
MCDTKYCSWYRSTMTPLAKNLLDRVASWPDEDVAELNELAREIEARRTGVYVISDDEWADLQEGIRQADRKEFVSDEVLADADKRHGI